MQRAHFLFISVSVKMRLYLAVAVLLLALVAHSEAQDTTMEDHLAKAGDRLSEFGRTIAEKTKTALEKFHQSEFAVATTNFFRKGWQKLKEQVDELTQ
ncbi:apolipoprotein C-I isoform X1 [Dunckerocampus dactyliophorus]|uniref:apolipoprotein C-I isoform X1 n=1 Tax=Dunckerocampus dactyliophorus TaxID=161453 RepID=UPI0024069E28|nr:apolipoprotein C-I isoform X1 [Dunckerocampus dactyliophorus]